MCFQRILVGEIAIHPRNCSDTSLLHGGYHFAEQIATAEELAAMVIGDLSRIKGDNTAAV